jgi:hypothetical protein
MSASGAVNGGQDYQGVLGTSLNPKVIQMQGAGSTTIHGMYVISQQLAPAAVGANTTAVQTFTVPGLLPGDSVDVNKPSHQVGLSIGNVFVTAANTLQIQYVNTSGASITPATETYVIGGTRL